MADPQAGSDASFWTAVAAGITSCGALVTAWFRKPGVVTRTDLHDVRDIANEAINRVAVVEAHVEGTGQRLERIEKTQDRMDEKLDAVLLRLPPPR